MSAGVSLSGHIRKNFWVRPFLTTVVAVGLALASPHLPVPVSLADPLAPLIVLGLVLASTSGPRDDQGLQLTLFGVVLCALLLVVFDRLGLTPWTLGLQTFAVLFGGRTIGRAIGERIASPGHVFPAAVIAAAADIASVLSPEGPTAQLVASERAVGLFVLAAAVPGTAEIAPLLGVGDVIFVALLFGVAAHHEIPAPRTAVAAGLGIASAFAISAITASAVPALPTIGLLAVLFEPRFRRLEPHEKRTATIGIVIAVFLVAVVVLRARV